MEKNCELLRSFNLEAAEAGEPICWSHLDTDVKFITGCIYNDCQMIVTEDEEGKQVRGYSHFRMKPLAWVSDGTSLRPAYAGDKLYRNCGGVFEVIVGKGDFISSHVSPDSTGHYLYYADSRHGNSRIESDGTVSDLSWNAPKTKKEGWLNIYPHSKQTGLCPTREEADRNCCSYRVACIKVEWEE